jgi:hypothetical protein
MFFTDNLLSQQSRKELLNVRKTGWALSYKYGLGIYSIKVGKDMTLIGHEGIHNAFSFLWEERDILFIGSLNQEKGQAVDKLLYPIMRIIQEGKNARFPTHNNQSC